MNRSAIAIILLALLPLSLPAFGREATNDKNKSSDLVMAIAKKSYPSINWDSKSIVSADSNCDSSEDRSLLGYDKNNAYLLVIFGPLSASSKHVALAIGLSGQASNYLCGSEAELSIENLVKPPEEEVGILEGYKESKVCKGLNVDDGKCDPFHFYWDHKNKEFSYWRY